MIFWIKYQNGYMQRLQLNGIVMEVHRNKRKMIALIGLFLVVLALKDNQFIIYIYIEQANKLWS